MAANIITVEDLENFKLQVFEEMKNLFESLNVVKIEPELDKLYLRSNNVERMMNLSPSKLQTMRLNGSLPFTKFGGVIYYAKADIVKVLEDNKRNPH